MSSVIGTPSRDLSSGDRRRGWPSPFGGATGIVSIPARDAAQRGEGIEERPDLDPPLDGAWGAVDIGPYSPPPFDWSTGGWHGSPRFPMATPRGAGVTHYLRMFFANIGGVIGFTPPRPSTTGWTTDVAGDPEGTRPLAPIPHDRKRIAYTMRELFDSKLYADYLPPMRPQSSQWPREIAKGVPASGPKMLEPYFPLLTRWQRPTSYGQTTQTLVSPGTPAGPGLPPGAS